MKKYTLYISQVYEFQDTIEVEAEGASEAQAMALEQFSCDWENAIHHADQTRITFLDPANANCLEGVKCPKCGQQDRFKITAIIDCLVTDDGSDPIGDHYWDQDSSVECPDCGFQGVLRNCQATPG